MNHLGWLLALLMAAGLLGCARTAPAVAESASRDEVGTKPVFAAGLTAQPLVDLDGQQHRPFEDASTKAVVLIFVLPDCPIANACLPEVNRLRAAFADQGIRFFLVQADPRTTAAEAREHATAYQVAAPVVLDPEHFWVRSAGAKRTPETVVFSRQGDIIYQGRIDDAYVDVGKRRTVVTSHDLHDALEAFIAGRPVDRPRTEPVGCFIPE
jgi:hypothetical protein